MPKFNIKINFGNDYYLCRFMDWFFNSAKLLLI